eukprot:7148964-Prymnesium_polylepis.2
MLEFYESIDEFKEEDFLLACAHLSKGLFYGGRFTAIKCPDPNCGYSPTATQARADLARFKAMSDEEQKEARRLHVKEGAHWHVRCGATYGPHAKGLRHAALWR